MEIDDKLFKPIDTTDETVQEHLLKFIKKLQKNTI